MKAGASDFVGQSPWLAGETDTSGSRWAGLYAATAIWAAGTVGVTEISRILPVIDFASPTAFRAERNGAGSADRAAIVRDIKAAIGRFLDRLDNWDGDDGSAPSMASVLDAESFLALIADGLPLPDTVYSPGDGEIMFQWRRPGCFIEVGFFGDSSISWFARIGGMPPLHGDDPYDSAGGPIPDGLLLALKSVA